ncbi:hypothetical protein IHE44_0014890 [Lamprotornis superbus]|uniref:Zinc transporter n=1 Tax=Lamprotornis superbus TaxID=245042 RepID=A0A835P1T4_9PASS|nr:hypothetical protein IHE44_0014890 [Lamprotornis superbus]
MLYVRAEVLAGFVNGLFLIFTAFFIFSEGVERALEPPDVHHERLLPVSILGFIGMSTAILCLMVVSAMGTVTEIMDTAMNINIPMGTLMVMAMDTLMVRIIVMGKTPPGVFLHIVADTLGSIGVIISAILMQNYGLMIADPICSMLIALLIGVSIVPLLKESIGILMQRTPPSLENALPQCYQRVQQLQGVYSLHDPHFWTLCTDVYIGTLKLLVAPDADGSLQILPLPFLILFAFPGDTGAECPPSRLHVPHLSAGLLPGTLSHLADAVPGPEFLTERWKLHSTGSKAGFKGEGKLTEQLKKDHVLLQLHSVTVNKARPYCKEQKSFTPCKKQKSVATERQRGEGRAKTKKGVSGVYTNKNFISTMSNSPSLTELCLFWESQHDEARNKTLSPIKHSM